MALFEKKIIVKNEIDYEKLSNALAKAIDNDSLVKSIEQALTNVKNKEEDNNKLQVTSSLFASILISVLAIISVFAYIFSVASLWLAFYNFVGFTDEVMIYIMFAILGLPLSFLCGGVAYEICHIRDFNRIIATTSAFTSIAAAIFAFATLIITYRGMHL